MPRSIGVTRRGGARSSIRRMPASHGPDYAGITMSSLAVRSTPTPRDPTPPASIGDGLAHSALTPVFSGLRIGLHVLIVALTGLVIVLTLWDAPPDAALIVALALVFLASYAGGGHLARTRPRGW